MPACPEMQVAQGTVGKWQRRFECQSAICAGEAFCQESISLSRIDPPSHVQILDVGQLRMRQREFGVKRGRLLE
jgi:hypothetical protein